MHALSAESPTNSVVLSSRDHAGRSRSYASGSHEHNGAVQFGKQNPDSDTRIRTQGQSVVDYLMGPAI
jgi:hypothetical protein